jgi:hypothetical protein
VSWFSVQNFIKNGFMLLDSEVLWAEDIESGFWLLKYYYFAFHFILWLLERFLLMTSKYVD